MTYSAHKYKSISNKIKLYWSHKAWDYSAVDWIPTISLSVPPYLSLHSVRADFYPRHLLCPWLLPGSLPPIRRPAAPESHPNFLLIFQRSDLGGAPPPDRGEIPVPSGGSASAACFLGYFPLPKGGSGMGCLPCFGSAGEGAAKKGGARKDGSSDRRVTRVGSGAVSGERLDLAAFVGWKWPVISSAVRLLRAKPGFGWVN